MIVCSGPGGVGKTTVSASIAIAGALLGRRVCVITIDPAKRLADSLTSGHLDNSPHRIEHEWEGSLDAVALDAKTTFDDLIRANAATGDQVDRILESSLYQSLVSSLSGTQEYMATQKLHELIASGNYDLVVVDTPPSRNALDFLAAPERLSGFLDNRVMKVLLSPARSGLRAAGIASEFVLRSLGRIAGKAIVEDAVAFFRAFAGMEDGFRDRAESISETLRSPATAFVLVATPRRDVIREIEFFASELADRKMTAAATICNRVQPVFGPSIQVIEEGASNAAWNALSRNLEELSDIADGERQCLEELATTVRSECVVSLPLESEEIHDLTGLEGLARRMLSGTVR